MNNDYTRRAFAAYFRSDANVTSLQPSSASGVQKAPDGKEYVVLRNTNGILAVYRIKTDGILKRLKRYPADLEK